MKINNVEKFRDELYKAMIDNYLGNYELTDCVWKDGHKCSEEEMKEEVQYIWNAEEERPQAISLPFPLWFPKEGISITVDEDGVCYWDMKKQDRFDMIGYCPACVYRNKMSFSMAVVRDIEKLARKLEEKRAKEADDEVAGPRFSDGEFVRINADRCESPSVGIVEHHGEVVTIEYYVERYGAYKLEELEGLWTEGCLERV